MSHPRPHPPLHPHPHPHPHPNRLLMLSVLYLCCVLLIATATVTSAQIQTGGAGYALQYDGVQFSALSSTCGSVNPFSVESVTMEAWFNIAGDKRALPTNSRTTPDANSLNALSIMGNGWEAGYELQYDYLTNQLKFQTQGPGFAEDCWVSYSKTILPPETTYGRWHHVAAVYNHTSFVKSLYLDGTLVFNATCPGATLSVSTRNFFVGGTYTLKGLALVSSNPFYGQLDEIRLWKVPRTQQQIQQYLNRGLDSSLFPQLVTYLSFNEGSGFIAKDVAHVTNEYLALPATLGNGKEGWAPKYVPSTAPIVGQTQITQVRTTPTTLMPLTSSITPLPIGYLHPITGSYMTTATVNSPATVTIRGISDARYLPFLRSSTGAAVSLNQSFDTLRMQPLTAILPNTNVTEAGVAIIDVDYILTIGNDISNLNRLSIAIRTNTIPTIGHSGYTLQCDGINDYAYADSFRWNTSWAVTVEVWALTNPDDVQPSGFFSVGNSELVGQWCPENPKGEPDRCQGRFMAHIPWTDNKLGWHYGWIPGVRGSVQQDISPQLGQWTHFALTSEGRAGIETNGMSRIYANGVMIGEVPADGPIGPDLKGLLLCDWRYWGFLSHKGQLDDFRMWNRVLSPQEIKQRMYMVDDIGIGKPTPPGLVAAYDFNEDPSTSYAIDISGNGHDLMFGGCSSSESIKPPNSHSGIPHCGNKTGSARQDPAAFPSRLISLDSRHGGYAFDQLVPIGVSQISIVLNGSDPDGDRLYATIDTLPNKGTLLAAVDGHAIIAGEPIWQDPSSRTVKLRMNITAGSGGRPYTIFSYTLSDGLLKSSLAKIAINVPCGSGTYLNNVAKICVACPAGTYQPVDGSFVEACIPVPVGSYQPNLGSSSYLNCTGQTFSDSLGASVCKECSDYDYPYPCIMTADVHPKAQTALNAISIIALVIVSIILVIVLIKRHSRVIFSSSTLLTSMCLIGSLGLLVSVILLIQPQTAALCTAKHWVFHLSFGMAFLSLFAKTYRIDAIFNSKMLKTKKTLTDYNLVAGATCMLLYDAIILAVWTGLNPMSILSDVQKECMSSNELVYQLLLFIPKVIMVLGILTLAFRVRHVPSLFNETSSLYFSMSNTLLISLIVLLLSVTANISLRSQKVVVGVGILYGVSVLVSAFMGPKLYQLAIARARQSPHYSSTGHSHKSGSHEGKSKHSGEDKNTVIGGVTGRGGRRRSSGGMSKGGGGGINTVGISKLSTYSLDGINVAIDEKNKKLRELETAIINTKEKTKALESHAQQINNEIHMLLLETQYRDATSTNGDHTKNNNNNINTSQNAINPTPQSIGPGSANRPRGSSRGGSISAASGVSPSPKNLNIADHGNKRSSSDLDDVRLEMTSTPEVKTGFVRPHSASIASASHLQAISEINTANILAAANAFSASGTATAGPGTGPGTGIVFESSEAFSPNTVHSSMLAPGARSSLSFVPGSSPLSAGLPLSSSNTTHHPRSSIDRESIMDQDQHTTHTTHASTSGRANNHI